MVRRSIGPIGMCSLLWRVAKLGHDGSACRASCSTNTARRALPAMRELSHSSIGYPLWSVNVLGWLGNFTKLVQEIEPAVLDEFRRTSVLAKGMDLFFEFFGVLKEKSVV